MVPPTAGLGHVAEDETHRYGWMTAERMPQVRAALLGLTLFIGLAVWVFHSLGAGTPRDPSFVSRLRGVGILTWIYALVQLVDQRWYHSRFAQRRLAAARVPEIVLGWLLGQMLAAFGILYFGLTEDVRWFVAGLVVFLLSFVAFPIKQ